MLGLLEEELGHGRGDVVEKHDNCCEAPSATSVEDRAGLEGLDQDNLVHMTAMGMLPGEELYELFAGKKDIQIYIESDFICLEKPADPSPA